jgi:hypothetical protein
MKKVLFVCIENSCRSQIAGAFAKIHRAGIGVILTPAVIIDGKVGTSGRVPEVDEVKKSLTTQG